MSLLGLFSGRVIFAWLASALVLVSGLFAEAPQPVLVKNIHEAAEQASLDPGLRVALGDKALFIGHDSLHGGELWVSDGTQAGTRMIKDIWPGRNTSAIADMTVVGTLAFFSADDGVHGRELWVTDGMEAGTRLVSDLVPGEAGSEPFQLAAYASGVVFLTHPRGSEEIGMWFSTGSVVGTKKLRDAPQSSREMSNQTWGNGDQAWVFLSNSEGTCHELWAVLGGRSAPYLHKLATLPEGAYAIPQTALKAIPQPGGMNYTLLFCVLKPGFVSLTFDCELWKTRPSGTTLVKSLMTMSMASLLRPLREAVVGTETAFFKVNAWSGSPAQVWMTDGKEAGTVLLNSALPGSGMPVGYFVGGMQTMGRKLIAELSTNGNGKLWTFDPLTQKGKIILEGSTLMPAQSFFGLARLGDRMIFAGQETAGGQGCRLWITDGTAEGCKYVSDELSPGNTALWGDSMNPSLSVGGAVYFPAGTSSTGIELWKTNGTAEGTTQITDLQGSEASSFPESLRSLAGLLYFTADDGVHGRELWRSDGTDEGTFLLKDIREGSASSSPGHLVEMNGVVYFTAYTPELGTEIWRTDGTSTGTVLISDLSSGNGSGVTGRVVPFKGRLYFSGPRINNRTGLWSTDGTAEGTQPYSPSQNQFYFLQGFIEMDGWLYFTAYDATLGRNVLQRIDGVSQTLNAASTPAQNFSSISLMVVRPPTPGAAVAPDKHVLFIALNDELWRCCNGESPVLVHRPGVYADTIKDMQLHGDGVLLVRNPECHRNNLWRSNGTAAGTGRWGPEGWIRLQHRTESKLYYSQVVSDEFYFHRALACMNLDGSGTQAISPLEILPFGQDSYRQFQFWTLFAEGETVYFGRSVNHSLWALGRTRGTPESTRMLSTLPLTTVLAPDTWHSLIHAAPASPFQKLGSRLYFAANDGLFGDELYALNIDGDLESEEVLAGGHTLPIADGGTLTMGDLVPVGQSQTRMLRLCNEGALRLTDITVSLPAESDFEAGPATIGKLDPGEAVEITVGFTPVAGGERQDPLQITGMGSAAITHTVNLMGAGLGTDEAPVLRAAPPPGLALAGQPFTLTPDILTASPFTTTFWRRDTTKISESFALNLTAAKLADAGVYSLEASNGAGTVNVGPIPVGVITPAPAAVAVKEWGALSLTCLAKAPQGFKLDYQWLRNGNALTDTAILKGSHTAVLKISRTELTDAGAYECVVTLATAQGPVLTGDLPVSRSAGLTNVAVNARPRVLVPQEPLSWMIGEAVSYQMTADVPATGFTAKGLPPGLKMSKTGLITGNPTRSLNSDAAGAFLPFQVTVTAMNAVGAGPAQIVPMQVHAFMPAGGYDCLLDPVDGLTHGSHLKFTVTSTGAFSGQLLHGGRMFRFTSRQLDAAAIPGRHFQVNLSTQTMPLMLMLIAPETEGQACVATLTQGEEGVLGQLQAECRRHLFSSTQPAAALMGAYTWSMMAPGHEESPPGSGFMTATVARTGIVNWRGRLADGTAVTGSNALSSFAGGGVDLPVHVDLYKLTGALHGAAVFGPGETSVTLSGSFFWDKDALPEASKERNYKAGFSRHEVGIEGSRYQAPAAGEYLFGIVRGDLNAQVDLFGGDMGVTQGIELSVKHTVRLPAPTLSGLFLKSLSFSVKTGTFKGSVLLLHESDPKLNRTATFEGLILSHEKVGRGFMLLPELPAEGQPASAIKTTPLRSVTVMVSAM